MATLKDVAALAGVSTTTISRYIHKNSYVKQDTARKIKKAMQATGYTPIVHSNLNTIKKNKILGILVSDVSDTFFGTMVKHIEKSAKSHGLRAVVCSGYHDEKQEKSNLDLLIESRCQCYVVHAKALSDAVLINYAKKHPSMVFINRFIPEIANRCIDLDNISGAFTATQHFINLGHKNIGFIGTNHNIADGEARKIGFQRALERNNLFNEHTAMTSCNPNADGGEKAMLDLLLRYPTLTAIVAYNDWMAVGAIAAIKRCGKRVPEDISVIGFDNSQVASYVTPTITTINYPIAKMAEVAAEICIKLSNNELSDLQTSVYVPYLIERQSVKKLS